MSVLQKVKTQDLKSEMEIQALLLKRIRVYNYIPPKVEGEYVRALLLKNSEK